MTREEIIRMARAAGFDDLFFLTKDLSLERFAALVAAAEREACAAICDGNAKLWNDELEDWGLAYAASAKSSAAKIRARGQE